MVAPWISPGCKIEPPLCIPELLTSPLIWELPYWELVCCVNPLEPTLIPWPKPEKVWVPDLMLEPPWVKLVAPIWPLILMLPPVWPPRLVIPPIEPPILPFSPWLKPSNFNPDSPILRVSTKKRLLSPVNSRKTVFSALRLITFDLYLEISASKLRFNSCSYLICCLKGATWVYKSLEPILASNERITALS
jgi:hypothetical protein